MDICRFSGSPVFAPGTSDLLVGAAVYVYLAGTSTPATVYQDYGAATPHSFPIVVDSSGLIPPIYWGDGTFRVRVEMSASDSTPVWDFDGIKGEILPVVSGGGGSTPADAQLKQTGDVVFRFEDGVRDGYVRANGRTIGSVASSATERANDDTEALFLYGWEKWDDTICPVVGGRGANAASDWSANKQLTLPNGRGKGLIGLDTMGNSAENTIQRTTTVNTTQASTTATVGSASGLTRYMYVVAANVPAGTYITDISGSTITMSQAATATATGTAARFSLLTDAQKAAATGGKIFHDQASAELATHAHAVTDGGHSHGVTDPGHAHGYVTGNSGSPTSGTAGFIMSNTQTANGSGQVTSATTGVSVNAATTGIAVNNTGLGNPMNIVQPSIGGTFYIKL